jgi:hypothetical protein
MNEEITIPSCIGEIRRWYCEYCSVDWRLAGLCTLFILCQNFRGSMDLTFHFEQIEEE